MTHRLAALALLIVVSLAIAACGSDNGGGSPGTTIEQASAADKAKLTACLKRAGIRVVPSGKVDVTVEGRVPRVPVPAEYLGAAQFPSGGFYDLWLAADSDSAASAAEELNDAVSQELGSETRLAAPQGQVVSAVGGNVQIDRPREILPLFRCAESL